MGMECPYLAESWRRVAGVSRSDDGSQLPPLPVLQHTEWSPGFESAMRARLIMGAFRYGRLGDDSKPKYDRIGSIESRAKKFRQTRNKELLVDIANLCLLEFVEGEGTFDSIDDGEHVQTS